MKIYKDYKAKPISYDSTKKRKRKDVKYIVIHYTGNHDDTAKNNAIYFANSNPREAGAHFFVDAQGIVYKSINMNRTAWAVGGDQRSGKTGEATYYGKCTNYNSVSIELCDACTNYTEKQAASTKELIAYIQKYCPNAKTIIRHWDVNGKQCPLPMVGKDNKMWKKFKKEISK
jgi:N-acetylmuramoyl-L-alanine amidase CwlA